MIVLTSEGNDLKENLDESQDLDCCDCGRPATYVTDEFGIRDRVARCRECHEQACRRNLRHDVWLRYG